MAFKFVLTEERIQGEWSFAHMQLMTPVTGNLVATRVFRERNWDPWLDVEVKRPERFIDLTRILLEEAPLEGMAPFRRFWDQEIERRYYFLVDQLQFGDGRGASARKRDFLRKLYDILRNPDFKDRLTDLKPQVERVIRTVKLAYGTEEIQIYLVSLPGVSAEYEEVIWSRVPTPEEEAACACKLDLQERFIFVDPTRFSASETGSVLTERELLSRSLWKPPLPQLGVQIFREALALEFAVEVQGAEWEAPAGSIEAARVEFAPLILEKPNVLEKRSLERKLATSLSYNLGIGLVRKLREDHSLTELFSLSAAEIAQAWRRWLDPSS